MGSYAAEGENRALRAVEGALASPLLKDNEIEGARYILLNISSGDKEVTMDEVSIITDFIQQEAGLAADLIWGNCTDEGLGEKISVTIIATGFQTKEEREVEKSQIRKVSLLTPELAPMVKPVQANTFMEFKKEEINEPVLKSTEESQVDLFAGYFHSAPKVEEEKPLESDYVRHTLNDEIPLDLVHVEKSFEFEIKSDEAFEEAEQIVEEAIVAEVQVEEIPMSWSNPDENKTDESIEEQLKKSKERILRLKDLSMKLRTTNGLQELENEPAYKRKQMSLHDVPHSSESQVSRFTLSNDEGITEIRPNNSFLHDNVD
jgi:cell division protein FtsZ